MIEEDLIEFGPCCSCGQQGDTVRNLVMLEKLAPVAGTGWGCVTCGLDQDGALAVICDPCVEENNSDKLHEAIRGYPNDPAHGRIPIDDLEGEFSHDDRKHGEAAGFNVN